MALIDYLRGTRDLLEAFFSEQLPQFDISHVDWPEEQLDQMVQIWVIVSNDLLRLREIQTLTTCFLWSLR